MDSNAMVNSELDGGAAFLEELRAEGVEVTVAFWAKLADACNWTLYVASPAFDRDNDLSAYGVLQKIFADGPAFGVEFFDVQTVEPNYSMAVEAAEVVRAKAATPRPYMGVTRFRGSVLGGYEIDGAYIYPPPRASVTA